MQSTRFLASNMLRMQSVGKISGTRFAANNMLRAQPARKISTTPKRMMPVPKEEHSAHTISQRLRTLKRIPPELVPLGVVLAAALIAAGYSMAHKLFSDKSLRLTRSGAKEH